MKAVIIKVLIAFFVTYLGASFIWWDFQWYENFAKMTISDRLLLGIVHILIVIAVYIVILIIELSTWFNKH